MTTPPSARRATRVIAISEAAKADLVETLGLPPEKIDVTPLGFRLDDRVAPAPEAVLRARFELGDAPGRAVRRAEAGRTRTSRG